MNPHPAELTARWIASGEVAHPYVIETAQRLNEAYNRHNWDEVTALEAHAVYVNHRQLANGGGETRSLVINSRVSVADSRYAGHVHRCARVLEDGDGQQRCRRGTTGEGTTIEVPAVIILLFDGFRLTRMDAFDLNQRDQALARFDELNS